ncbi:unnamed protein product [Ectocarpus sp. 8 AP-2014]
MRNLHCCTSILCTFFRTGCYNTRRSQGKQKEKTQSEKTSRQLQISLSKETVVRNPPMARTRLGGQHGQTPATPSWLQVPASNLGPVRRESFAKHLGTETVTWHKPTPKISSTCARVGGMEFPHV